MRGERIVSGLSCSEVLAHLTEYLDGRAAEGDKTNIEAHVRGCDHCAKFGGTFAGVVRGLRARLLNQGADPAVLERLRARLGGAIE